MINRLPGFKRRLDWFIENRKDLTANVACMNTTGMEGAPAAFDRERGSTPPRAAVHAR